MYHLEVVDQGGQVGQRFTGASGGLDEHVPASLHGHIVRKLHHQEFPTAWKLMVESRLTSRGGIACTWTRVGRSKLISASAEM